MVQALAWPGMVQDLAWYRAWPGMVQVLVWYRAWHGYSRWTRTRTGRYTTGSEAPPLSPPVPTCSSTSSPSPHLLLHLLTFSPPAPPPPHLLPTCSSTSSPSTHLLLHLLTFSPSAPPPSHLLPTFRPPPHPSFPNLPTSHSPHPQTI